VGSAVSARSGSFCSTGIGGRSRLAGIVGDLLDSSSSTSEFMSNSSSSSQNSAESASWGVLTTIAPLPKVPLRGDCRISNALTIFGSEMRIGFDGVYWTLLLPNHAIFSENEVLWPFENEGRVVLDGGR
jgi:hypothetical protein